MLSHVNVFNSRLIFWQFEQIVMFDIFQRKSYFYSHHLLEKRSPSFALVRNLFVVVGGSGDDDGIDDPRKTSMYQIIPFRLKVNQATRKVDPHCLFQQEPMSYLKYPRRRHCCVTDGEKYIYILGGDTIKDKVERYDVHTREVETLLNDSPFAKGISISACYQNLGSRQQGIIYVLMVGTLFALRTNGASVSETWQEWKINFAINPIVFRQVNKQGMT